MHYIDTKSLNHCSLFGYHDEEIIQILYNKISEKYSKYPSLKERYNKQRKR